MVAESEDTGAKHQRNFHVEPALDYASRRSHQMDQGPRHDASDQYFPGRLDPQVNQPPPPEQILRHVAHFRKSIEVEDHQRDQIEDEYGQNTGTLARLD